MLRVRFKIKFDDCGNDYRPVVWPIKHPYWCTGEGDDHYVLLAYVDSQDILAHQWPEAYDLEIEEVDKIEYTSRFKKPDWYEE